jgi:hypothetical protein
MVEVDEAMVTSALQQLLDVADLDITTEEGLEQRLSEQFNADMATFRPIIHVRSPACILACKRNARLADALDGHFVSN